MYQEISQLLMYGDLDEDSILAQMGEVFGKYETGEYNKTGLVRDINTQVKRILKVATDYGFDDNLWHNYLTFLDRKSTRLNSSHREKSRMPSSA